MNTDKTTKRPFPKKKFNNNNKRFTKPINNTPEQLSNLVYLLNNNAEIRRFTALGIINLCKQKGLVKQDAKCYIKFLRNKYSFNVDGLKTEFNYNNEIFITCLVAAFPSFAHYANKVINEFLNVENCTFNEQDVENVIESIKDNNNSPVEGESQESTEE